MQIGSYRLVEALGAGGMSNVYRAVHVETGHVVALKVLPRSLARNATMLQRFLREARSAEALQDPNIVAIYDRGTEGGRYYLVLEYLAGGDLHERVRTQGPLAIGDALEIVKTVARAMRHAESLGMIHRDIKPANLLLTGDGRVKVADLGLALQPDEDDERVTRDGTTVGTVDYMAPEQARDSRAASVRSDIYSLGCTFYYLLAGQPPFAGGDLPEKLRKHAHESPPDIRELRPDVPEALALLIQRMMAKKPDRRYLDFEHLLMALKEIRLDPSASHPELRDDRRAPRPGSSARDDNPTMPLMWSDDDRPLPVPSDLEPSLDSGDAPSHPGTFRLGPAATQELPPDSTGSAPSRPATPPNGHAIPARPRVDEHAWSEPPRGVDFAALREVEPSRRPAPSEPKAPVAEPPREVDFGALRDIEPGSTRLEPPRPMPPQALRPDSRHGAGYDLALRSGPAPRPEVNLPEPPPEPVLTKRWLVRSAIVAAALLLAVFGLPPLVRWYGENRPDAFRPRPRDDSQSAASRAGPEGAPLVIAPRPAGVAQPAPVAWSEPAEPAPTEAVPATYDEAALASLDLRPVLARDPGVAPSPVLKVRRAGSGRERATLDAPRRALDQLAGTVEIADDGPFFEQDWRVAGSPRVVRAAEGFRPMLVVQRATLRSVQDRPALVVLQDQSLTLEGIDLVVRAADLSPRQEALFLCRGGELTLRDCTITVEGPIARPLAAFQLGAAAQAREGPARLRLERTLVRGDGLTALRLAGGPAEVELVDSALLDAGAAPLISIGGGQDGERRLAIVGSVLAGGGPLVEMSGSAARDVNAPSRVRALGSLFARIEGRGPSGLVAVREPAAGAPDPRAGLAWRGAGNTFVGWPAVAEIGAGRQVVVPNLDALRAADVDAEPDVAVESAAWGADLLDAWTTPAALARRAPEAAAILGRVASPTPNLRAWTVGAFERLGDGSSNSAAPTTQELAFDADQATWSGDLGRFLAKSVDPIVDHVRVRVHGSGRRWMTPIRLRDGLSLELIVEPPTAGAPPLVWTPVEKAEGDALLGAVHGDLTIQGARFERDAGAGLRYLVAVDQGRLELRRCRLVAPGNVEQGGGGLIAFRTEGSRPLDESGDRPVARLIDCLLMTGGEALTADLGRGVVAVENCAIAAGTAAFVLRPARVARGRFEADLQLDRCTILAERDAVRLGAWRGTAEGPDRPWLVATRECAWLDPFDRAGAPSTALILRADTDALARGVLIWQSQADAFGLNAFLATGDDAPRPSSFPDLRRDWVAVWGPTHVLGPVEASVVVRTPRERILPGKVQPADLALLPPDPRRGPAVSVGADAVRLPLDLELSPPR
jgi:serine/threonine protein kinase